MAPADLRRNIPLTNGGTPLEYDYDRRFRLSRAALQKLDWHGEHSVSWQSGESNVRGCLTGGSGRGSPLAPRVGEPPAVGTNPALRGGMKYLPDRSLRLLRLGSGLPGASFRDGQEDATRHIVEGRGRLLVVQ